MSRLTANFSIVWTCGFKDKKLRLYRSGNHVKFGFYDSVARGTLYVHRVIMQATPGAIVCTRDGNDFDLRRANLEVMLQAEWFERQKRTKVKPGTVTATYEIMFDLSGRIVSLRNAQTGELLPSQ